MSAEIFDFTFLSYDNILMQIDAT